MRIRSAPFIGVMLWGSLAIVVFMWIDSCSSDWCWLLATGVGNCCWGCLVNAGLCSEFTLIIGGFPHYSSCSIPTIVIAILIAPNAPNAPPRSPPYSLPPHIPPPHTPQNSAPPISYSPTPTHDTLSSAPSACFLTPIKIPFTDNFRIVSALSTTSVSACAGLIEWLLSLESSLIWWRLSLNGPSFISAGGTILMNG